MFICSQVIPQIYNQTYLIVLNLLTEALDSKIVY